MLQYDLNCKYKSGKEKERQLLIRRLYELGYDGMAWNQTITGKLQGHIKPLAPINIDTNFILASKQAAHDRSIYTSKPMVISSFRQLSRITLVLDDLADAQTLHINNLALHAYDIIAACPGNQKIFQYLCQTADIDIISFDFHHRLNFSINKKLLDAAVKRGIHFEISYSGLLQSPGTRREMLSSSQLIVQYLHNKHIILTSAADVAAILRGPSDVINIGTVLNIPKQHAVEAISMCCHKVIQRAQLRRLRKVPMELVSAEELRKSFPSSAAEETVEAVEKEEEADDEQEKGAGFMKFSGTVVAPFVGEGGGLQAKGKSFAQKEKKLNPVKSKHKSLKLVRKVK